MSDGNEEVLHIPQSSSIAWASQSDCFVSYPGHAEESFPFAEIQSVYSTAPSDWAILRWTGILKCKQEFDVFTRNQHIGLVGREFGNGPGDLGPVPGRVIPNTLKTVLDTSLLNIQQYKVRIKGKVEQSRERSSALPYTSL